MKKIGAIVITAGSLLSAGYFMLGPSTVSDAELQQYIQDSLARGCRPVIDVCTSDCGTTDPLENVSEECASPDGKVIRVSYTRAQGGYVKLAQDLGISATTTPITELPDKIREKLADQGIPVEPVKEDLILTTQP
jgi:hypothetical protein